VESGIHKPEEYEHCHDRQNGEADRNGGKTLEDVEEQHIGVDGSLCSW
jgi:hypothetical protein